MFQAEATETVILTGKGKGDAKKSSSTMREVHEELKTKRMGIFHARMASMQWTKTTLKMPLCDAVMFPKREKTVNVVQVQVHHQRDDPAIRLIVSAED